MANVIKQGRAKTIAPIAAAWAVVFTGFVVTVVNSWGPLYRWNLFLHPALGLLTFVPLILYLRRSLRSRGLPISPRLWIDGPGAAAIVGPLILIPLPSRGVAFALFSALLLYLIVGNILLVVRSEDRRRLPAALSTSLSLGAWALLTFTGLAILILARSGGMTSLFLTHRAMALCFVVVFSTLAFSAATGLHGKASASGAVRRGSGPALAAGAVALGLLGVVALIDRVHRDPAFEVHLSTIPIEDRTPEEQTMFFADPAFPRHEGLMMGVRADNILRSLSSRVLADIHVQPVYANSREGHTIYRHSLCFLLAAAATSRFPDRRLIIGHSLGNGFFYSFDGLEGVSERDLLKLRKAMHEMVERDLPIRCTNLGYTQALRHFETHRQPDTRIYWHLNETYLGETSGIHQMEIHPQAGEHTITITDEFGESAINSFTIMKR